MVKAFQVFYYNSKSEICHDSFTVFNRLHQPDLNIICLVWWYNLKSWTIPTIWETIYVPGSSCFAVVCLQSSKSFVLRKKSRKTFKQKFAFAGILFDFKFSSYHFRFSHDFDLRVFPTCGTQYSLTVDIGRYSRSLPLAH